MSLAAIEIRKSVAATRRACPDADVDGVAEYCIAREVPAGLVKAVLFDLIVIRIAARPGEAVFRRAPLSAVLRAGRRHL